MGERMKHAPDWSEHELAVHQALPYGDIKLQQTQRKASANSKHVTDVTRTLRSGFYDYVIEDADDKPYTGDINGKFAAKYIREWAKDRPRPLRIVRATHLPGDGLILRTKTRAVIQRPKAQTWFVNHAFGYTDPDTIREMCKNLLTGMPVEMVAELYNTPIQRIRVFCDMMGFDPKADKDKLYFAKGEKPDN
jgi:hypothetical protein